MAELPLHLSCHPQRRARGHVRVTRSPYLGSKSSSRPIRRRHGARNARAAVDREEAPLTRGLPLAGHLPWFWADTTGFLLRLARDHGDIAVFRLGTRNAFLLSHPEHVQRVLVDDADAFLKGRLMRRARRLMGDGLLTSEGEAHRVQRRRLQPAFCRHQLARYGELVSGVAARATASCGNGPAVT